MDWSKGKSCPETVVFTLKKRLRVPGFQFQFSRQSKSGNFMISCNLAEKLKLYLAMDNHLEEYIRPTSEELQFLL